MVEFVIGVDVHKRNHTFVAVNSNGRQLGSKSVTATASGHRTALQWARTQFAGERLWGIEDVRPLSTRLEAELMDANEAVVRVPPKLTARQRSSARSVGKSDPIDALAVARAVLREPDLPVARHDAVSRELRLLVDRRDNLVSLRTATSNRMLMRLHELDPEHPPPSRGLRYATHRGAVHTLLDAHTGILAEIARHEIIQIDDLTASIRVLTERITDVVRVAAPSLLALDGCGPLTAAKIVGETADVTRFTSEPKFACYSGVAPVPHWSGGNTVRHFRGKHGNRQLNRAFHTIALSQIRKNGAGDSYYRRRLAEGDSHANAMRILKRQVCRAVYARLRSDRPRRCQSSLIAGLPTATATGSAP